MATTFNNLTQPSAWQSRPAVRRRRAQSEIDRSSTAPSQPLVSDFSTDEIRYFQSEDALAGRIIVRALCGIFSVSVLTSLLVIFWTFVLRQTP